MMVLGAAVISRGPNVHGFGALMYCSTKAAVPPSMNKPINHSTGYS